jgi:hypothetical protein
MNKVKLVKDVPVGVLIIVLSQFIIYGVVCLANYPSLLEFLGISFGVLISSDMVNYGLRLIKGYKHVDANDE